MRTLHALGLTIVLAACSGELVGGADSSAADAAGADAARDAASVIDAASVDAARSDAASAIDAANADASAGSGCAAHAYLFCEDWESATSSALPAGWSVGGGWMDGNPSITSAEHHGGTHALRSAMAHSGQHRAEHSIATLGAARGHHWGRVFYRVATPAFVPPTGTVIHNTMVALLGSNETRVVDTVFSDRGDHQFLLNIPDDSCCVGSSYDYHSFDGAWHCAEWFVDDTAHEYRFYYDGTEVTQIAYTSANGVPFESFSSIAVGLRNYQDATMPYDAFFDDLAIDSSRVGCNP